MEFLSHPCSVPGGAFPNKCYPTTASPINCSVGMCAMTKKAIFSSLNHQQKAPGQSPSSRNDFGPSGSELPLLQHRLPPSLDLGTLCTGLRQGLACQGGDSDTPECGGMKPAWGCLAKGKKAASMGDIPRGSGRSHCAWERHKPKPG